MSRVMIPKSEYRERALKAGKLIKEKGLDVLVVNGTESDYANPRYFSAFWPVFERSGVAINQDGDTALMVGPESPIFAADKAVIKDIFMMREYIESANPQYPHLADKMQTYVDVFKHLGVNESKIKIGLASPIDTTMVMYEGLTKAYPNAEIVDASDIMVSLRQIKSENEIACLREGARISDIAIKEVIEAIKPGMTELQLVGIAHSVFYREGAEAEGLPIYCFSQKSTQHAISRSGYDKIQKGDLVQLNFSAKIDGYSSAIGLPISMGPLTGEKREIVEFLLEAHRWTTDKMSQGAGLPASELAIEYEKFFKDNGREDVYVYGPCHSTGMIEVEAPWIETISTFNLEAGMTYQIDTFGIGSDFGCRWEKPIVIRENTIELLSPEVGTIYEIDC
ncbi:MAG TPA: aminopeptidase P family protein [Clostridiaceae bacterium]|nr:aminopeptidase P family protein [Clostridiaceae bacterium]